MARISGIDLPRNKKIEFALQYIYGIGKTQSVKILSEASVDCNVRVNELSEEGLFDSIHKKELPKYPTKIAVITSIGGEVIKDILDVISRNSPYLNVTVRNSRMQGNEAVQDLLDSIDDNNSISFLFPSIE